MQKNPNPTQTNQPNKQKTKNKNPQQTNKQTNKTLKKKDSRGLHY